MPSYIATGDHFSPQIVEEKNIHSGKRLNLMSSVPKRIKFQCIARKVFILSVVASHLFMHLLCLLRVSHSCKSIKASNHGSLFSRGCVYICYRDLTWHRCGVVWAAFLKLSSLCLLLQLKVHRAGGHEGTADVNGKRSGQAGTHKHEWSWTETCVHYCCL